MAINKVINNKLSSHEAMRDIIEYVLNNSKVKEGYVDITGPYFADTINYADVYRTWLEEKRFWEKDSGRMYAYNIISFHPDEKVTPEQVLEIGRSFCEKFFQGYQCLIGVHQDKDRFHCHIVTNSVSFLDGHKLHQSKIDLAEQKLYTNELCREMGLSVTEKGKHFDGTAIEEGQITAWSKNTYDLLQNNAKKSFIAECANAVMETIPNSFSKDEFITQMGKRGWFVQWDDAHKYIVFSDAEGHKIRDKSLNKTFGLNIGKEELAQKFERQND